MSETAAEDVFEDWSSVNCYLFFSFQIKLNYLWLYLPTCNSMNWCFASKVFSCLFSSDWHGLNKYIAGSLGQTLLPDGLVKIDLNP